MVDQNAFVVNVPTNRTVVVAVRAITDSEVVAHGTKSSSVIKKTEPGIPVLMHIPQPGKTYIY